MQLTRTYIHVERLLGIAFPLIKLKPGEVNLSWSNHG